MRTETRSGEEIKTIAAEFAQTVARSRDHATLVTLSGELGAGKTTFAQGLARALGVAETVTSPTFVIEKIYPLSGQQFERLIHIDAYRLKSAQELEVLGWRELLADSGNLIVLEWPERVAEFIPEDAIAIKFDIAGDGRIITINDGENSKK